MLAYDFFSNKEISEYSKFVLDLQNHYREHIYFFSALYSHEYSASFIWSFSEICHCLSQPHLHTQPPTRKLVECLV